METYNKKQNIEEQVEDYIKSCLKENNIRYYHKTESVNEQIDNALKESLSKQGNFGGNYPDIKLLINNIPVMIEVKSDFDRLVKFNNKTASVDLSSFTSIQGYAVNGAIHYANNIVSNSNYEECIAVGITGWYPASEKELKILLAVYKIKRDEQAQIQKEIKTLKQLIDFILEVKK